MKIGVPKETAEGERRVAMVPDVAKALSAKEIGVVLEAGAGDAASYPDSQYTEEGAEIGDPWAAEIVAKVTPPTQEEISSSRAVRC